MKGVPHVVIYSIRQLLKHKGEPVPERDEDAFAAWATKYRPDAFARYGVPEPGQEGKG